MQQQTDLEWRLTAAYQRADAELPAFAVGSRVRVIHGEHAGQCGIILAHRILGPVVRLDPDFEPLIQFPPRWLEAAT